MRPDLAKLASSTTSRSEPNWTPLLSFEEITQVARQFVALGDRKICRTGGEPLLRKNLEELLVQLAALRTPVGQAINLTMTTNGAFLSRKAKMLKPSGLNRVTISLDALDDRVFKRMNDVDFPVVKVLEGIEATLTAGITNIKVNMVAKRWVNDHEALAMARFFQCTGVGLGFIDFMDVGSAKCFPPVPVHVAQSCPACSSALGF